MFHAGFVFEQFAIKMAWIPIDQDTAKIEHRHRTGESHAVILANANVTVG
jgi:hypothetical protein